MYITEYKTSAPWRNWKLHHLREKKKVLLVFVDTKRDRTSILRNTEKRKIEKSSTPVPFLFVFIRLFLKTHTRDFG